MGVCQLSVKDSGASPGFIWPLIISNTFMLMRSMYDKEIIDYLFSKLYAPEFLLM